ncbi:MAG: thioredoxin family protein [Ignavibacteriaceae bacterium]
MPALNYCTINEYKTYDKYIEQFTNQVNSINPDALDEQKKHAFEILKLNLQRTSRLDKTFESADEIKDLFSQITTKQQWIVITETWCGDSAQIVPVIAKLAQLNNNIDLKILLRDSNLDYMELYLTNGGKAIPKLIVYDENNDELFQWGPRPKEAQELFTRLKNEGMEKSDINKELHLWYGRNRGKEIEKEIFALVKQKILI